MKALSFVLLAGLMIFVGQQQCFAQTAANLLAAGEDAFRFIKEGKMDALNAQISSSGILIVSRNVDWDKTERAAKPSKKKEISTGFAVNDYQRLVWEEQVVQFDLKETKSEPFRSLVVRFGRSISGTYDGSLSASVDQVDAWRERHLGPAVTGKIASNTHWYMYFVKEGDAWKLWKLEYAQH